ncbi:MAG TPA: type I glutamate--ammonia ligase [Thermoleophilaceae bacterium]|jgi:glutamine synthetase|nr:type I glutamate--ammonia ligase [Thermoleophilaceae bacterium]
MTPLTVERFVGERQPQAKDVLALAQEHGVRMVDFKFTDLPGMWQHLGLSIHALDEEAFVEGLGFDGSSIRGFQEISESDMVLLPDPSTAVIDPFHEQKTLSVVCNVIDPITRELYSRDPRYVAQKAEAYLVETGIADTCFMGPEAEFFIFDHVAFDQRANTAFYEVDSEQAYWNMGQGFGISRNGQANLGYKLRSQQGYFPTPPGDTHGDLRARIVVALESMGIRCEFQHHEVGSAGQAEINVRFATLGKMADQLQLQKYVVKNVARAAGKTATFMPKPLFEENGSGMHVHISLGKGGENLMYDFDGYAQLSREALNFIGGLLAHGRAVMAFCAPTTNSYRRLVPGYEAPVNLVYSQRNRSAACRIPVYSTAAKAKRVEFRPPDPSANPYLAFSALLMAGLDGIQNRIDPGAPLDEDLFELPQEELRKIEHVPGSLDEALDALQADHEFLLKGDVFTPDLIETWISHKRDEEADQVRLRPHPWEFALYYDA